MYPSSERIGLLAIRVSSGKQKRDGDSPEEQRQRGESLARTQNIKIVDSVVMVESASHQEQPMQAVVEKCRENPAIEAVLIKAIDRFTRGGSSAYIKLKEQLDELNVTLIDTFGIIDSRRVNTLEHTGFKYYWSDYSPSFKSEILEAEHAKDELRDIMTRMIGAQIRYTQLGYWMRKPPYGFISEMIDSNHGKRTVLRPHPEESMFVRRVFEMKDQGIYSNQEIADACNNLGFKTRTTAVRDKYDPSKVKRIRGGKPMDEQIVDRFVHRLIYAGVIKEKWTYDKPIKARFDGIVSVELFNNANHGKHIIEINNDVVTIHRKEPPEWQKVKKVINDKFPYKKAIGCPICGKPLSGSAARGKMGKYYPAYHCSRDGHYFRKPLAEFEQAIERFVGSLEIAPEHIDKLIDMIAISYKEKATKTAQDGQKLVEQKQALKTQIRITVDRMKILTSETAIKYMEEDILTAEEQIKTLDEQLINQAKNTVNMEQVLQYAKYLLKHLHDLVFNTSNPLRRSAFFGLIFNTMPTYADIDFETLKNSPSTDMNGLFQLALGYKSTFGEASET